MRYDPATDKARTIEDLAAETRQAITRPTPAPQPVAWGELLKLAVQNRASQHYINCCELSHGQAVAQAMGNWGEARRLRAQLIAGLY